MKFLLLSDINSSHTQKWATALARKGIEIGIFSLSKANHNWFKDISNIFVYSHGWVNTKENFRGRILSKLIYLKLRKSRRIFSGEEPESDFFWGDYCKKHIKFIRNHVFNGIKTSSYDRKMPYKVAAKSQYSNYWFSSSDGHTVAEFTTLLKEKNLNALEKNGGFCVIYTHFASGFLKNNGTLNKEFERCIRQLAKRNGWFVPANTLLEFLLKIQLNQNPVSDFYLAKLDALWLFDRIIKKIKFGR